MRKEIAYNAGDTGKMGSIPGQEDPLEKEIATYSSILAWKITQTEEPGGHSPKGHKQPNTAGQLSMHMIPSCIFSAAVTVKLPL